VPGSKADPELEAEKLPDSNPLPYRAADPLALALNVPLRLPVAINVADPVAEPENEPDKEPVA